jgi:hypothetical protein
MDLIRGFEGVVGRLLGSASTVRHTPAATPVPAAPPAPDAQEQAPDSETPVPQGRLKRRVQVLADLVAIAKEMGAAWPEVPRAVEAMAWLPPPGQGNGRRLQDVAGALLECAVGAADASLRDPAERRRMRPVLRDLREALEMYALHRIETSSFQGPAASREASAHARFVQQMDERAFPALGIDWSTPDTIRAGVRSAVAGASPKADPRSSYVPNTSRGRRYEDLPMMGQIRREEAQGSPRMFSARVDVVGLLAARACAHYDLALRRATADKLRPWILEQLPGLETGLAQAFSDWMIDVQPGRLKSWQPIEVSEVEFARMPYAAFEDALATRILPKSGEEAATVVRSKLIAFVDAAYARERASIDAARDEYAAESRVEMQAERQVALALGDAQAPSQAPVFAP